MKKAIKHTWVFDQSPEIVWEYLTNSDLLAMWLMKNDFQPLKGHKFMFLTKPMPEFGFDGNVHCEVLEIEPCTKLSYSWKGGPGDGTFNLNTVATWTLEAVGNGTELKLEHSGFEAHNAFTFDIMNKGWEVHIKDRITKLINERAHEAGKK